MRTVIAIGLALWASAASALTLGPGTVSCGRWQQERQTTSADRFAFEAWVLGYITRANDEDFIVRNLSAEEGGLFASIDNYCRANPRKELADAAKSLALTLRK
jgi:hypothetical protein